MYVSNKTKFQQIIQIENKIIKKMKLEELSQSSHLDDHLRIQINIQLAKVEKEINQINKNDPAEALRRASEQFFFQSQAVKTINKPLNNEKNNKKEDEDELQFVLEL